MTPDPKWLEILKASGWQTTAIAGGCGVIFALISNHILPSPGPGILVGIAGAGIICASLAVATILSALVRAIPVVRWLRQWDLDRRSRRSVEDYLPFMTDRERGIIGYLLHHKQKTFTGDIDGGYANTLIARGLIVQTLRPGQVTSQDNVPHVIPDLVWDVFSSNRDWFPEPPSDYDGHPWRVHWMAR